MDNSRVQANASLTSSYEIAGEIFIIPLLHIYVDSEFNCRGYFSAQEVCNLGKDIQDIGQKVPLIIQPMRDVAPLDQPDPCAWKFRLIAGHRRYTAIDRWTDKTHAECIIKCGLSPQQAQALNLTENLKRHDLNMLQEAQGMNRSWPTEPVQEVAYIISESRGWVQARRDLLILPEYVQRKAAAGILNDHDIATLATLDEEEVEPMFQKLVLDNSKPKHLRKVRGKQRGRQRSKTEIKAMIGFLYSSMQLSSLSEDALEAVASTLSWVMRGIDSKEFAENRLLFPADCVMIDESDKIQGVIDD